jgi:hypothetical protein
MSFTSASGTRKARKEFILSGATSSPGSTEYEALRPTRFEKKTARSGRLGKDIILCTDRSGDSLSAPLQMQSIHFDNVRTFQNLEAFPHIFEDDEDVLYWLCGMAAESPAARLLLKNARDDDAYIMMADLGGQGYAIDSETLDITIDHFGFTAIALGKSAHYRNIVFLNFIRALRERWHAAQNYDFESTMRPDAVLMLERVRVADVETIAILIGWELRAAGHSDIWRSILGSDEGDMAMIFTRAIEKDPAGLYDGSALTRTLCQWYGDEVRVAETDAITLEIMDEYLEHDGKFGRNALNANTVEMISRLPDMRPYLHGMGDNIASDPYFLCVHDTINESHLFQVIYDSNVTMVEGVPFRDSSLARKIFPMGLVTASE